MQQDRGGAARRPIAVSGLAASGPTVTPFVTRAGMGFCVRPNRYALALATGAAVGADVFALHECDIPVCVKVNHEGHYEPAPHW